MMQNKKYLVSFGDSRLGISIHRFKTQAKKMNIFDEIYIYTETSLPLEFNKAFKDKMYVLADKKHLYKEYDSGLCDENKMLTSRGFGYWCWKPKIVLMMLEQMQENDMLVYADIGCEFNFGGKKQLEELFYELNENEIITFITPYPEIQWNKADFLNHFNLLHDQEFLNSKQICATCFFLKKTQRVMDLVGEWMDFYFKHFDLIDDSLSKIPNLPQFIEHRHDQSIFSVLAKKYKAKTKDNEATQADINFPILHRRNKIYLSNSYEEYQYFENLIQILFKKINKPGVSIYQIQNTKKALKLEYLYYSLGEAFIKAYKKLWGGG